MTVAFADTTMFPRKVRLSANSRGRHNQDRHGQFLLTRLSVQAMAAFLRDPPKTAHEMPFENGSARSLKRSSACIRLIKNAIRACFWLRWFNPRILENLCPISAAHSIAYSVVYTDPCQVPIRGTVPKEFSRSLASKMTTCSS